MNIARFSISMTTLILLSLQAFVFGKTDWGSFAIIGFTFVLLFQSLFTLSIGNRKTFRAYFKEQGNIYGWLSNERPISSFVLSAIGSLTFGLILIVTVSGMLRSNGIVELSLSIILVFSISYLLYTPLNKRAFELGNNIKQQMNADIAKHANSIIAIVLFAFLITLLLSSVFSIFDTYQYFHSQTSLENFQTNALKLGIMDNGHNAFSRIVANIYIFVDEFKLALVATFIPSILSVMSHIPLVSSLPSWLIVYLMILFLNFFKFFGFSIAFVVLQKGLNILVPSVIASQKISRFLHRNGNHNNPPTSEKMPSNAHSSKEANQ